MKIKIDPINVKAKIIKWLKNIKARLTANKVDHLREGDCPSFIAERIEKGIQAEDTINPKCPASIKPIIFGQKIYEIPVNKAAKLVKLNPRLDSKYIPIPPSKECKKIDMIKAESIENNKNSTFGK